MMLLDRETLLVFGVIIPGLLGVVAMGVGGSLKDHDRGLWLWGLAMLMAGGNQVLLLAMASSTFSLVLANASFLAWVTTAVIAVGRSSGRQPHVPALIAWAAAAWLAFAACVWAGDLRLGRLLNWPNIVAMLLLAVFWAVSDRRKRMPMARALLLGGLVLEALAIAFRTLMVAIGDDRAILLMRYETAANMLFLSAALLGLVLGTLGMLLNAMDGMNRKLRFALEVDALTRLASRHAFFEEADRLLPGTSRALLMVDVDHFKSINDRFGHAAGDAVLRHLGGVLRAALPPDCLSARIGGEEFAVLLPSGEVDAALDHAERLRTAVSGAPCRLDRGGTLSLTVSVGVAVSADGIDALLHEADAALYRAKAEGRNRSVLA